MISKEKYYICEVCEGKADRVCASLDQPALYFCEKHYKEHVKTTHNNRPIGPSKVRNK